MDSQPIGVLLSQIGTPPEPTAKAVRRYLKRFLSDRRVIDTSPLIWQPILRGIVLRVRPKKSAVLYRYIWTEHGSPLHLHSRMQQKGLQKRLGSGFHVELGLAYSEPDVEQAIAAFEQAGITRIVILPMFPQYSSTTTATVYDSVSFAALGKRRADGPAAKRFVPALRFIDAYYDHPGYIEAMRQHLDKVMAAMPVKPDHVVLSFHGIPERYADTGDPYPEQCRETAGRLAEAMGWHEKEWTLSFQSRFGRERWVGPATMEVLHGLPTAGVRNPLVFSPGLVTDCLETLHELAVEGREVFAAAGGEADQYSVSPCLNADETWLDFLAELIRENAQGWSQSAAKSVPL
ncbi:ferrochelatase [Gorillibacterium massiliense]|uniref:ferrochelatase n=1 Tax=Gorillibacterium massiliense TaxID=1280390 RepID=UPI0004B8F10D|nr:ferrochelatase [Gorillibacterium massiliense]